MLFNYHTHTRFSDGTGEPEMFIKQALDLGFDALGFSEHSPLPFENTFALNGTQLEEYSVTVRKMAEQYAVKIKIWLGMEMDYIPGYSEDFAMVAAQCRLDYTIGSVHLVVSPSGELWFIDGPVPEIYDDGLAYLFDGDIRKAVTAYYHQINRMVETQKPDIIGHLDKIKMHNRERYFREDEPWYKALVSETLGLIAETGTIVEVNTRGIYKKRSNTTFPGIEILKQLKKLGVRVTISSDAHKAEELNGAFDIANQLLAEADIKEVAFYNGKGWEQTAL
jgi:histidinol phosphate phosphatase HisJ family